MFLLSKQVKNFPGEPWEEAPEQALEAAADLQALRQPHLSRPSRLSDHTQERA